MDVQQIAALDATQEDRLGSLGQFARMYSLKNPNKVKSLVRRDGKFRDEVTKVMSEKAAALEEQHEFRTNVPSPSWDAQVLATVDQELKDQELKPPKKAEAAVPKQLSEISLFDDFRQTGDHGKAFSSHADTSKSTTGGPTSALSQDGQAMSSTTPRETSTKLVAVYNSKSHIRQQIDTRALRTPTDRAAPTAPAGSKIQHELNGFGQWKHAGQRPTAASRVHHTGGSSNSSVFSELDGDDTISTGDHPQVLIWYPGKHVQADSRIAASVRCLRLWFHARSHSCVFSPLIPNCRTCFNQCSWCRGQLHHIVLLVTTRHR